MAAVSQRDNAMVRIVGSHISSNGAYSYYGGGYGGGINISNSILSIEDSSITGNFSGQVAAADCEYTEVLPIYRAP